MTKTVDVIVPVFNQGIEETPIISNYMDDATVRFYVCDNSEDVDVKESNRIASNKVSNVEYIDMEGNKGISKAYNAALKMVKSDIICIFDDDTVPGDGFFNKIRSYVSAEGVYLPVVKSGDRILSPLNKLGPIIYPVNSIKRVNLNKCSAFNTGMTFTSDVARKIRYNEKLFIEFVDHDFCRRASAEGIPFFIMEDVVLEQNYSVETNSLEAAIHRDSLGKPDVREYYSNGIVERIYCELYLAYRAFRNSINYKTLSFFGDNLDKNKEI